MIRIQEDAIFFFQEYFRRWKRSVIHLTSIERNVIRYRIRCHDERSGRGYSLAKVFQRLFSYSISHRWHPIIATNFQCEYRNPPYSKKPWQMGFGKVRLGLQSYCHWIDHYNHIVPIFTFRAPRYWEADRTWKKDKWEIPRTTQIRGGERNH